MNWLKAHADSVAVIAAVAGAVWWMTSQIYSIEKSVDLKIDSIAKEVTNIQKEVAIIKTVLIMQDHMPKALATKDQKE